jgi:hypothetical protein
MATHEPLPLFMKSISLFSTIPVLYPAVGLISCRVVRKETDYFKNAGESDLILSNKNIALDVNDPVK